MLTPRYLESAPDAMVDLYSEVEADILADMARRACILRPSTRPRSSSRCSAQGFGRPRASLPT